MSLEAPLAPPHPGPLPGGEGDAPFPLPSGEEDAAFPLPLEEGQGEGQRGKLPAGWAWARLGDVVNVHDHRRVPINLREREARCQGKPASELFPYYGATGQVGLIDGYIFEGDHVLLGEDGAPFLCRNKPKAYIASGRYWVNNHAHILRSTPGIELRWLLHSLNWTDYEQFVGGTTRLKLTLADLVQIPIPVAPSREQRRIVARIDALFAEIEEGEAALARAKAGLEAWRRALLKAAVTGELTREWRAANKPAETGGDLLARIRADQSRAHANAGRGRRIKASDFPQTSFLPSLPDGWGWTSVGEIATGVQIGLDRSSLEQSRLGDGTPYIKMNNITTDGRVLLEGLVKIATNQNERERYAVLDNDILFNTRNSVELVGKLGIIKNIMGETVYNNNIMRIRTYNMVDPSFLCFQMCSPFFKSKLEMIKKATTSVAAVYWRDLSSVPIAFPSLLEQMQIAELLDTQINGMRESVALIDDCSITVKALRQSILKSAFEGRLVAQDPSDEPASTLLARLRAERSPSPRPSPGGRGSRLGRVPSPSGRGSG